MEVWNISSVLNWTLAPLNTEVERRCMFSSSADRVLLSQLHSSSVVPTTSRAPTCRATRTCSCPVSLDTEYRFVRHVDLIDVMVLRMFHNVPSLSLETKGPVFVLEDGKSAISLNDALMWAKVNPFSPLGTGLRINPFWFNNTNTPARRRHLQWFQWTKNLAVE